MIFKKRIEVQTILFLGTVWWDLNGMFFSSHSWAALAISVMPITGNKTENLCARQETWADDNRLFWEWQ